MLASGGQATISVQYVALWSVRGAVSGMVHGGASAHKCLNLSHRPHT